MGKGKTLNEREKGRIDQLKLLNWSNRKIAEEIGRSRKVVDSYVANSTLYGLTPRSGRPKSLGKKTIKKIINISKNKVISCKKIKSALNLQVTPRTILNCLHNDGNLACTKMQGKPPLLKMHKEKRMEMAFEYLRWTSEWKSVVFSDEKKFNLDGPDGLHNYWHCLGDQKVTFSKRVQGGGSVMIWVAFCYKAKTPIVYINTKMNSESYIRMLRSNLVPFTRSIFPDEFIFQQDNAPCHRARNTQSWLEENSIKTIDWPARSPDLNPVENLFGILAKSVYRDGRQFNTVNELKCAITESWNEIESSTLKNLINSMPNRMVEVIKTRGGSIKY